MATFEEFRDELRSRKLVEAPADFYSPAVLLDMLVDASREIAGLLRFPRESANGALLTGASSYDIPNVVIRDVLSFYVAGLDVPRVSWSKYQFLSQLPVTAWPRGWFYDSGKQSAADNQRIVFGPELSVGRDVNVEYILEPYQSGGIVITPGGSTEVWNGLYEPFHEVVLLRATVKAIEMGFQFEDATYYMQRYQMRFGEFAQFLGIPMSAPGGGE